MAEASVGYAYVWAFQVAPGQREEFLRHYGPDGTWAALFRRAPGYVGTILLHDRDDPGRFLTIDRWASREAHDAFLARHGDEYARIDALCESLTEGETSLGSYREVEPFANGQPGAGQLSP